MKIIIAANERYKPRLERAKRSCKQFGYEPIIYNLGGLGYGKPWVVDDARFHLEGAYTAPKKPTEIPVSRALFKPSIVADAMKGFPDELIAYFDADVQMLKPLDIMGDYDIGVAMRSEDELHKTYLHEASGYGHMKYQGRHNAGVIFFNPTERARAFVAAWAALTAIVENDQLALNTLLEDKSRNVVIKRFPHSYNAQKVNETTVIHHYKGTENQSKNDMMDFYSRKRHE